MDREITLEINTKDISFKCSTADIDRFTNEVDTKDKISPMHNFLMRTVFPVHKDDLAEFLKHPGATGNIFSEVYAEATGGLKISVKKSSK